MNRLAAFFKHFNLFHRVILVFSALIVIQFLMTAFIYTRSFTGTIIDNTTESVVTLANTNARFLNDIMSGVRSAVTHMIVDHDFLSMINSSAEADFTSRKHALLNTLYYRYFEDYSDYIQSFRLVSEDFSISLKGPELSYAAFDRMLPDADDIGKAFVLLPPPQSVSISNAEASCFTLVRQMISTVVINSSSIIRPEAKYDTPFLLIEFNPKLFSVLPETLPTPNSSFVITFGNDIIVTDPDADESSVDWDALDEILNGDIITMNRKQYIAVSRDLDYGLRFASLVPIDDLTGSMQRAVRSTALFFLLSTVITIAAMLLLTRSLFRPMSDLAKLAEHIDAGTFLLEKESHAQDDVGAISSTVTRLNDWVTQLARQNQEIAHREQEATVQALEMQLNPHFLYNTLNGINLIALRSGQDEISRIVVNLSAMMHYTFNTANRFVRLSEELSFLEQYVFLMKQRFPERFDIAYDIEEEARNCVIPKMIIQLCVENAILHGFRKDEKGGRITVSAAIQDKTLKLEVADNGAGIRPEDVRVIEEGQKDHIGCANINKRLRLLFGSPYGLRVASLHNPTVIEITVPRFIYSSDLQDGPHLSGL